MKTPVLSFGLGLAAMLVAAPAQATCFVEYKAKQDSPLRLHYGIVQLGGACPDATSAERAIAPRLGAAGWTLLNVVGLSDTPPSDQKRANAGDFYLRF